MVYKSVVYYKFERSRRLGRFLDSAAKEMSTVACDLIDQFVDNIAVR